MSNLGHLGLQTPAAAKSITVDGLQSSFITKTDGVSTLVPVDGTLLTFTVDVTGPCLFGAEGYFGGTSGLVSASLSLKVDGSVVNTCDYFSINGSGGDRTGPLVIPISYAATLTAGVHTCELNAAQTNMALQASAANPLVLWVIYPKRSVL